MCKTTTGMRTVSRFYGMMCTAPAGEPPQILPISAALPASAASALSDSGNIYEAISIQKSGQYTIAICNNGDYVVTVTGTIMY